MADLFASSIEFFLLRTELRPGYQMHPNPGKLGTYNDGRTIRHLDNSPWKEDGVWSEDFESLSAGMPRKLV